MSIRWYRDSFTTAIISTDPIKIVLNTQFNPITFQNDFALLHFEPDTFPALNVIQFHFTAVTIGLQVSLAGFGLINQDATSGVPIPNVGALEVAACPEADSPLLTTETHMCASSPSIALCSGDNGSGIFATIDNRRVLV